MNVGAADLKTQARDRDKANWLQINSIALVALSYSESEDEWKRRIINREA